MRIVTIALFFVAAALVLLKSKPYSFPSTSSLAVVNVDTIAPYLTEKEEAESGLFDAEKAVNHAADVENSWYNDSQKGISRYAGTEWLKAAAITPYREKEMYYDRYSDLLDDSLGICPMHCTHYAIEALRAGMGEEAFARFDSIHETIWAKREYAGWSVAYVLVTYFAWEAIVIINEDSEEYVQVTSSFQKRKTYPVWRQPAIPLAKLMHFPEDKTTVDSLLKTNTFGWGFSNQGWHTWFTRYDELLECNWWGSPSMEFEDFGTQPLFLRTRFVEFADYDSHVICFPGG